MNHTTRIANPVAGARLCLADFLPYRLNVLTQAVSHGLARHYADVYGISVPEWRIIATAGEFGEMTARDIASHSRMSKVTTSRAAASLIRRKLIARRINREDRRESFLRLTAQGQAVYADLAPKALAYQAKLMEGMSPSDIAALDRIIARFMKITERDASGNTPFEYAPE
jgi:DNA-binding MarR family transcriptional regulator